MSVVRIFEGPVIEATRIVAEARRTRRYELGFFEIEAVNNWAIVNFHGEIQDSDEDEAETHKDT